jgi:Tfp pilus assembly protein FimV
LQEIATKSEQAAQQKAPEPTPAETQKTAPPVVAEVPAVKPPESPAPGVTKPAQLPELDKIRKCEACGFPVSEGRTLCLDCEAARLSGERPAPLASSQAPAFLSEFGNPKKESWLSSHIYTIGTILIAILTVVLLVLRMR